jgi:hypothetical protein
MASEPNWIIEQNFIDEPVDPINVYKVQLSKLNGEKLAELFGSPRPRAIGVTPAHSKNGKLAVLVIAAASTALVVQMSGGGGGKNSKSAGASVLEDELLAHTDCSILGFDLERVALSLYQDFQLGMTEGIDIQSTVPMNGSREPLQAFRLAVGDQASIWESNVVAAFNNFTASEDKKLLLFMVSRAWSAWYISTLSTMENLLYLSPKIDTIQGGHSAHVSSVYIVCFCLNN